MHAMAITPILNVSNMQQSFDWFECLGWTKSWEWGEPISFGCVGSGECQIFLCLDGQGGRGKGDNVITFGDEEAETGDKGVWMSIWIDDVDGLYQHCLKNGIEVTFKPEDLPWNVREMHVRHPDGHVFRMSQSIGQ
ncbi:bleomycin resistance family protein [Ketobacter sp.]|uniref:bleomycin resistance family protein n=1 Tax=Ketobacter sp. TaxID=2083498 RepID=UPI000F2A921F|nr:bleomycin resistance family protein [Ketobacter sp.]RLU01792.1 MAG: bleomycin resistance family protein [Ketobacter sp.]